MYSRSLFRGGKKGFGCQTYEKVQTCEHIHGDSLKLKNLNVSGSFSFVSNPHIIKLVLCQIDITKSLIQVVYFIQV